MWRKTTRAGDLQSAPPLFALCCPLLCVAALFAPRWLEILGYRIGLSASLYTFGASCAFYLLIFAASISAVVSFFRKERPKILRVLTPIWIVAAVSLAYIRHLEFKKNLPEFSSGPAWSAPEIVPPSGKAGDIREFVAGIDWQNERLQSVKDGDDADLIVSVAIEKKEVWKKNVIAIGIRAVAKNDPRFPAFAGTGWGGTSGNRGMGSLMLRQINNEGYQAHLNLRWSDKVKGDGTFNQTFQCKWVDQQVFERDGFKIEITIKPNRPKGNQF